MQQLFVYADNAATTPVDPRVLEKMLPFFSEQFGNASTLYKLGQSSHKAMQQARAEVAALIGAEPERVFFTGSGTEADNMALRGVMQALRARGKSHIITTTFEHPGVLNTVRTLEKEGFSATYLPVDREGRIDLQALDAAIGEQTGVVSIMAANNEVGTVQDIAKIGALCRSRGVFFHTDAVQAYGKIPLDVVEMNIDLLALSAHKIGGPKGVGALYVRSGVPIAPIVSGGGQERKLRSGTENIPGIVGLGEAARIKREHMEADTAHLRAMSRKLIDGICTTIPQAMLTGHPTERLPGTCSFVFPAVEGESLVLMLDMKGICASTGSACSTGSLDPSHVLMALGLTHEVAHGSLRLSLAPDVTEQQIEYVIDSVAQVIKKLRAMSPVWKG